MKKKSKGSRKTSDPGFFNSNYIIKMKKAFADIYDEKIMTFVGSYLFYICLLTILYIVFKEDLSFVKTITASLFSSLLTLLGVENTIEGTVIYLDTISLKVIDECTGMYEILVYSGCVMAYSTAFRKKLIGIAIGFPVIFGVNMVRLVCLAFVGIIYPAYFDYAHYYLWQITLILIIVLTMLIWIEKVVKK